VTDDRPIHPTARPLADLPIDALADRAEQLAKRWASALILARPTHAIGAIPLDQLAREAPGLCAQVLRALESDAELQRLTGNGAATGREELAPARRLGALAGAADAASCVVAAEALRSVLWDALLAELREPPARLLADLADRLAHVCSMALLATIAAASTHDQEVRGEGEQLVAAGAEHIPAGPPPLSAARAHSAGEARVAIVDEHGHDPASPGSVTLVGESKGDAERPLPWEPAPPEPPAQQGPPVQPEPPEPPWGSWERTRRLTGDPPVFQSLSLSQPGIEIRAERVQEGPAAWIGSIGQQLDRFATDGRPFAVLLVEVADIERLLREVPPGEVLRLADRVQAALEAERRATADGAGGSLTCERTGRYWLLAPGTDGRRVEDLAQHLADAVRRSVRHGGLELEVAVGAAVCPAHGREAAALAAHADVALYAGRASGSARDRAAG